MRAFWVAALLSIAPIVAAEAQSLVPTQCVTTAIAGGTADAITIPKLPCTPTTALVIMTAKGANTSTTPTIKVTGSNIPPQTIKRYTGDPLQPGDIPNAGARIIMTNNGSNWFLLGPGLGLGSGIFGPGSSTTVGHPAVWSNSLGTLLNMPDQQQMTPTITVVGGNNPLNSAQWVNATRHGTANGSDDNGLLQYYHTEDITDTISSRGIDSMFINHVFGGGEGSRSGIFVNLNNNAATANPASLHQFYTAIFGNTVATVPDTTDPLINKGQFYAVSGQTTISSAAAHVYGAIGAEFDVGVQPGASVIEKVLLQLILYNNDSVRGAAVDAGIVMARQAPPSGNTTLAAGIEFGKPGYVNSWPFAADSNIIHARGAADTAGAAAGSGVDFTQVSFTNCAFASKGFCVKDGSVGVGLFRNFPVITMSDLATTTPATNGGTVRLTGLGATPDSYEWQINTGVGNDFSSAISSFRIDANGTFTAFVPAIFQEGLLVGPSPGGPPGTPPPAGYYTFFTDTTNGNKLTVVGHNGTATILAVP